MSRELGPSHFPNKKKFCSFGVLVSCVALRGFSLRGFWDVRGFPFCGGKTPYSPKSP